MKLCLMGFRTLAVAVTLALCTIGVGFAAEQRPIILPIMSRGS